jgi:hypothetical protein
VQEQSRTFYFKEHVMLIRKLVVAGFVLAAVGLTATVTTVVIGQQPGTTEKSADAVGKGKPTTGEAELVPSLPDAAGDTAAASDAAAPAAEGGAAAGSSSSAGGAETGASGPPAGLGSAAGATPGKSKGRGKPSTKTSRSGGAPSGGMMMGSMPGMSGAGGMMGMMPGGGDSGAMMGSGMMSAPVSEDEHLETWVSRALADYARNEDQNTRKQQRDEIAKALDRIFDIRQERRMEELETLEERVQKLRGTLETREKLKSDILKNRLDYLIREADGLGWGDGLPAPGRSAPTGMGASGRSSSFKRGASGGFGADAGSSRASGGPVFGEPFNSGGAGGGGGSTFNPSK